MKLYEIDAGSSQRHFIVADSYAEAERLWLEHYNNSPNSIVFVTPYVIVKEKK